MVSSKVVPDGWGYSPLSEITTLITKGATPSTYGFEYTSLLFDDGARFIRGNNATTTGRFDARSIKYICNDAHQKLKRSQLKAGDVIVSIVGSVGTSLLVGKNILPANINQNVALIRPSNTLISGYLSHIVVSSIIQDEITLEATTQAQPSLSLKQVGDFNIPLPPLPEQQKIAAILTSVDEVIEKTQAQIDKLKDLKTAMMQELLLPSEKSGVGTKQGAAALNNSAAGRKSYIPHTEFKDSPVGRIPKSWEVLRLKEITLQIRDGNYGADYPKAAEMHNTGVPFLTSTVVGNDQKVNLLKLKYISKEKHCQLAKAHIKHNDVLFTNRGANVGNVALVPEILDDANIGPQLTFLRVDEKVMSPLFLYIALQSDYFKEQLSQLDSGSAMNFFGIGTTEKFVFAVPPLSEQVKISNSIYSIMFKGDKLGDKLAQTKNLKKALMQDLLTGKVRVKLD